MKADHLVAGIGICSVPESRGTVRCRSCLKPFRGSLEFIRGFEGVVGLGLMEVRCKVRNDVNGCVVVLKLVAMMEICVKR